MNAMTPIKGFKGGGGKGGGSSGGRSPVESPDTLRSRAFARIIDVLCEGEIEGLVTGDLRSVYLDKTPVMNDDGSYNFTGVDIAVRNGTQSQNYVPGFPSVEAEVAVNVEVNYGTPVVRTISDLDTDSVRVTMSIPQLTKVNTTTGDTSGTSVQIKISVQPDAGSYAEVINDTITGKTTSKYQRSYMIKLTGTGPWNVKFERITADSVAQTLQNKTVWDSYTRIVEAKLTYPNTAYVAGIYDSQQFSDIPNRGFDIKGIRVQVPSNYDPETREYTGSWDGTFQIAWTDNPAWAFYDLLTNGRYGLGDFVDASQVDKWALYQIAQYCDELVPDGFGGMEPRFTCNIYIQEQREAFSVIQDMASIFRGMAYWESGAVTAIQDSPADPLALFQNSNVVDSIFTYQGSSGKSRHTTCVVMWNDPDDFYSQTPEYVEAEQSLISRYGIVPTQIVAMGCTSRGQAARAGKWLLFSEGYETETVSFKVGLDGILIRPGNVFNVQDQDRAGKRMGGRVVSSGTVITNKILNSYGLGSVVLGTIGAGGVLPTGWAVNNAIGLTTQIMEASTLPDGATYIDLKVSGTPSATGFWSFRFQSNTIVPALIGQSWTSSLYVQLIAGSLTNIGSKGVILNERNSGGTSLAASTSAATVGGTLTRTSVSRTLNNAATAWVSAAWQMAVTSGLAVDITIRLTKPQLENAATVGQFVGTQGAERSAIPTVTVDSGFVTVGGSEYELSVMNPDGSVATSPIDSVAGNVITLNTNGLGGLTVAPLVGAVWMASGSEVALQTFRCLTLMDTGDNQYELTGLKHLEGKYAYIEDGLQLTQNPISITNSPPDSPSNIQVAESLYAINSSVQVLVEVSWDSSPRATTYSVTYRRDNGNPVTVETSGQQVEIRNAQPGDYEFTVTAISLTGKRSPASIKESTVFGKTALPGNVKNFSLANISNGVAQLVWAQAEDLDVLIGGWVRVRHTPEIVTPDWSNAVDIGPAMPGIVTTVTIPHLPGTYLAKFVDSTGNSSPAAAQAITTLASLIGLNVISTITESPSFSGTKDNTVIDGSALIIDDFSTISDPTFIDQWADVDNSGVIAAGTYDFASTFDLGAIYTSLVKAEIDVVGVDLTATIDARTEEIDLWTSFDGDVIDDVDCAIFIRITDDDPGASPVWGEWQKFFIGQYTCRAMQFKLALVSQSPNHTPSVSGLSVTVDMPDRVEAERNISSGAGSYAVTYPAAFKATPAVAITPHNMATGDYYALSSMSATGFTVTFKNAAGTNISRTFDYMAKGYGYQQ